jgi:hypothetical protein
MAEHLKVQSKEQRKKKEDRRKEAKFYYIILPIKFSPPLFIQANWWTQHHSIFCQLLDILNFFLLQSLK